MDSELLRKIEPAELQNEAWMKKDKVCCMVREREKRRGKREMLSFISHSSLQKYSLAPNIMAMMSSFNQLALLIP